MTINSNFYKAFEDRHRGSRELIKDRLRQYLPFIVPLKDIYDELATCDLGCGRGEWLELMKENGFSPVGVDIDPGMLEACYERNLPAIHYDAVEYLKTLESESQVAVTAFHLVEHIPFERVQVIVEESLRVLKPGGLLILETPNPENIVVATRNFYLDPTHQRPIPSKLLSFVCEYYGFARVKVLRLQEAKDVAQNLAPDLANVLSSVSPDYSVVAQKSADPEILRLFDDAFNREYGLSLDTLVDRFDNRLEQVDTKIYEILHDLKEKWQETVKRNEELSYKLGILSEAKKNVEEKLERERETSSELKRFFDEARKEVEDERARVRELEERWKESERRIEELFYQVGVLSEVKKNLEEELERERRASSELQRFLDEARKEVEEERARVRKVEEELGFEKSRRHELESKYAALEHTVNAIYDSWSWRITYPLRLGLDVLRAIKKAFFYSVFKIWQIVTYPPKWILARAIKFVLRRPGLREFLHRQQIRFPRIYWGLYNFAVSRGIFADETIQTTMNSVSCLPSNTESDPVHKLSPRALQIYKRLKRAVEYYQSKVS